MVIETSPQEHTLVGILHGSSLSTCVPGNNRKVPGLFANLEHKDNLDFIEKWLPLGEYFASQDTNDTDLFYLKKLDPHLSFNICGLIILAMKKSMQKFSLMFAKTQLT